MSIKLNNFLEGNSCCYKSDLYCVHKCDGCGCNFKVRTGEYIYILPVHVRHGIKHLKFCSYNCRSGYKKTMQKVS